MVMLAIVVFQISVNELSLAIFVVYNFKLDVLLVANSEVTRMTDFNVKMQMIVAVVSMIVAWEMLLEVVLVLFSGPHVFTLY